MTFRTEPPVAPLPPIVEQMAVSHVQHVRDCECCGQGHLANTCTRCGESWPCDVSRILTTLWGDDVHERARWQRDARTSEPPW
jgi:hypothetical protein